MIDRHTYLLSGIIYCKSCGNRLIGRSGNSGNVCYYEHSPRSTPVVHLPDGDKKYFPFRVSLNQIEAALWEEILNLLLDEKFAVDLLNAAKRAHKLNSSSKELEGLNHTIFNVDRQLELLAERLASLPQSISSTPIYKQMEKLEERKKFTQSKMAELQATGIIKDEPAAMSDLQFFKRNGSITCQNGGGYAKVQELGGPTISQVYKLSWEREYLDLTELARLRWIEGWTIQNLANHFMVSQSGIKERIRAIKRNPNRIMKFNTKKSK